MTRTFLAAEDVSACRLPLKEAATLPPAAYTDEGIWERERTRVLARGWLPLARVDQVPGAGDYLSADLAGEPVMVVRGDDGTVRVLSRVCRHRSALVAEGHGCRKLFTCPYHAWSYDTKGNLVRAPLMEGRRGSILRARPARDPLGDLGRLRHGDAGRGGARLRAAGQRAGGLFRELPAGRFPCRAHAGLQP